MTAWAKVRWEYNPAEEYLQGDNYDRFNMILKNQYKDVGFASARPAKTTYVVKMTIRRDKMSENNFIMLKTKMDKFTFGSAVANKMALLSRAESPITFVDTSMVTSECSPPSSTIDVLITLSPMENLSYGEILLWLGSTGKYANNGFEEFLRTFFTKKSYVLEGGKGLKMFHIRA